MKMSGQPHTSAALPPGKNAGNHSTGGWEGPTAGLDVSEPSAGIRIPDSPARTLRYPTGARKRTEPETSQKGAEWYLFKREAPLPIHSDTNW
jgi:hypothetical protein